MQTFELGIEEVRALLSGNFTFFRCIECDGKGYMVFDSTTGLAPTQATNPDDIESETCETCKGIGGNIHFKGTSS